MYLLKRLEDYIVLDIEAIKNESESLKESIERAEEERTTMEERHTVECTKLNFSQISCVLFF